ncbi:hypothetical protein J5751_02975 [bacterium]|nr:hypothetical protein [bacterium]
MDKNGFNRSGYRPIKLASNDCGYLTPNHRIPFGKFEQTNHIPVVIRDLNWSNARHRDSVWISADLIALAMLIFALAPWL